MSETRIAVFASGGGSNFQAIANACSDGTIPARVALCVATRPDAGVVERAERADIPVHILTDDDSARSQLSVLDEHGIGLVALAGYMRKVPAAVVSAYRHRIMNIHPALLPAFGGKGLYGMRVHRAVVEHGVRWSGATVHFVDEDYDTGPIILQDVVPVLPGDTPESLAARVLEVEHRIYPRAVRLFAEGRLRVERRRVFIEDN
ncbi:MAG: phosphoribosylglycinamide formyltransferase [Rhodothermales bacterium]|nr:phosphoribosylglycinamide formyltransferase [Rhodothermales bacterium]